MALLNTAGADEIERKYGLKRFFDYLERSCGGHGNGLVLIGGAGDKHKVLFHHKGVNYGNAEIVKTIEALKTETKFIIYHTRLASCGAISDENCHPFIHGGDVLAQNGTEYEYTDFLKKNGFTNTDGEAVLILHQKDLIKECRRLRSAFIGMHDGEMFAIRNAGSLEELQTQTKNALAIASAFPNGLQSRRINEYIEGKGKTYPSENEYYNSYYNRRFTF